MQRIEHRACFGGWQEVWQHESATLACKMNFGIYLPPQAASAKLPVLYWLSGLTCSEQNFITKAGAQRYAAEHGVIIVVPDTSPRGEAVPDAEGYDLGQGAGFYLDATQAPWSSAYRMRTYVTQELIAEIEAQFPVIAGRRGIFGHSMGGHGALTLALTTDLYASCSALAPICAPSEVPWGELAFSRYLGRDPQAWRAHDASALLEDGRRVAGSVLVDQGLADKFLDSQLRPERLEQAASAAGQPLTLRRHEGYDHSYYFIATFVDDHLRHHAAALTR